MRSESACTTSMGGKPSTVPSYTRRIDRPTPVLGKFLADRGTHLAAMIAYFAVLAFVPILFLTLALIGFAGTADESSYLIELLQRAFPASSVDRLVGVVEGIQGSATELGIVGGITLLWAALGFFSVVESALNIVYGVPNRPFIHQKALVLLLTAAGLLILFLALVIGSVGVGVAKHSGGLSGALAYIWGIALSTALVLCVVWGIYTLLLNRADRLAGDAARGGLRGDPPPGELSASAALRPVDGRLRLAAGVRRARPAARLDLPDGERARPGRRGELVPRPRTSARRGASGRAGLTEREERRGGTCAGRPR